MIPACDSDVLSALAADGIGEAVCAGADAPMAELAQATCRKVRAGVGERDAACVALRMRGFPSAPLWEQVYSAS